MKNGYIYIGKLPSNLHKITKQLNYLFIHNMTTIDKNRLTFNKFYKDLPKQQKHLFNIIHNNIWKSLNKNKKVIPIEDMNTIYYSNPKEDLTKDNLYGGASNFLVHTDGKPFIDFKNIKIYRVLIGLTNGNTTIETCFPDYNICHKINQNDVIIFDFNKTKHQVIKNSDKFIPRIFIKLHFLICNKNTSMNSIYFYKKLYSNYELISTKFKNYGISPKTFPQYAIGLLSQWTSNSKTMKFLLFYLSLFSIYQFYIHKYHLTQITKNNFILILSYWFIISLYHYLQ